MEARGINKSKLAKDLSVDPSQVTRWLQEKTAPEPDKLKEMALYFGVTVSYLCNISSHDARSQMADEVAIALGGPEADIIRAFGALPAERRSMLAGKVIGWIEHELSRSRESPATRGSDGGRRERLTPKKQ